MASYSRQRYLGVANTLIAGRVLEQTHGPLCSQVTRPHVVRPLGIGGSVSKGARRVVPQGGGEGGGGQRQWEKEML